MGSIMESAEMQDLVDLSARLGADPLLVQGAGGNTSVKEAGTLWIKASGLWLKNARNGNMLVPVRLDPLLSALEAGDPACEKAADFVDQVRNLSGLRPSIETTVHALMPQKVVVHVHCVETIAVAVQVNAKAILSSRLSAFQHEFVPYARPGLPLAHAISAVMREGVNVLVLGNHGLVIAAETVAEAETLLTSVVRSLQAGYRSAGRPDLDALQRLAHNSSYCLPDNPALHAVATDLVSCKLAAGGSLYPDHVVFLGKGAHIVAPGQTALQVEERLRASLSQPVPLLLFPGKGVLVSRTISEGALAMAACLADVTARVPETAKIRYLSEDENTELSNWDAEKYRQALNRSTGQALQ